MKFIFKRKNYLLLISGLILILAGLALMVGGGSEDPNVFRGSELFSSQRITYAPILIISGFILEVFAIMSRSKSKK